MNYSFFLELLFINLASANEYVLEIQSLKDLLLLTYIPNCLL